MTNNIDEWYCYYYYYYLISACASKYIQRRTRLKFDEHAPPKYQRHPLYLRRPLLQHLHLFHRHPRPHFVCILVAESVAWVVAEVKAVAVNGLPKQ